MSNFVPVIGQQYRVLSALNPFFGIGTVTSVSTKDNTGTIVSEEAGLLYFNSFDLSPVSVGSLETIDESVQAIMTEIAQLQVNGTLPVDGVKNFSELHDYLDANVLLLKHVPRDQDWIDADDEVREEQTRLDNLIMDMVNSELQF